MLKRITRQIALTIAVFALAVTLNVLSGSSALAHGAHGHGHYRVSTSHAVDPDMRGVDKMQLNHAEFQGCTSILGDAVLSGPTHEVQASAANASDGDCNVGSGHALGTSCCGHACHGGALSVDKGLHQSLPRPQKLALQPTVVFWADIRIGLLRPPRA